MDELDRLPAIGRPLNGPGVWAHDRLSPAERESLETEAETDRERLTREAESAQAEAEDRDLVAVLREVLPRLDRIAAALERLAGLP